MTFSRQISRTLDEEHRKLLALLGQVEQGLARARHHDAALLPLLASFAQALQEDVRRHFDFEEHSLFPRLAEAGDAGIAELLREEHDTMREVATELLPLLRAALLGPVPDADWAALRRNALEMVERQVAHVQKETMALLPMLEELLDEQGDRELAMVYAES